MEEWKTHRIQGQASEENELLVLNWNCSVNDDLIELSNDSKGEEAASVVEVEK